MNLIIGDKNYNTSIIGNLEWTVENLKYDDNKGGVQIPNSSIDERFGYYYNYSDMFRINSILQNGWRIPNITDWEDLERSIGVSEENIEKDINDLTRASGFGNILKALDTWDNNIGVITDSFNFSAYASGYIETTTNLNIIDIGISTLFWVYAIPSGVTSTFRTLRSARDTIEKTNALKDGYYPIRLVRDGDYLDTSKTFIINGEEFNTDDFNLEGELTTRIGCLISVDDNFLTNTNNEGIYTQTLFAKDDVKIRGTFLPGDINGYDETTFIGDLNKSNFLDELPITDITKYGFWSNQGGVGGTPQSPNLIFAKDGSITSKDGKFSISSEGFYADSARPLNPLDNRPVIWDGSSGHITCTDELEVNDLTFYNSFKGFGTNLFEIRRNDNSDKVEMVSNKSIDIKTTSSGKYISLYGYGPIELISGEFGSDVKLYYEGVERIKTVSSGVNMIGSLQTSSGFVTTDNSSGKNLFSRLTSGDLNTLYVNGYGGNKIARFSYGHSDYKSATTSTEISSDGIKVYNQSDVVLETKNKELHIGGVVNIRSLTGVDIDGFKDMFRITDDDLNYLHIRQKSNVMSMYIRDLGSNHTIDLTKQIQFHTSGDNISDEPAIKIANKYVFHEGNSNISTKDWYAKSIFISENLNVANDVNLSNLTTTGFMIANEYIQATDHFTVNKSVSSDTPQDIFNIKVENDLRYSFKISGDETVQDTGSNLSFNRHLDDGSIISIFDINRFSGHMVYANMCTFDNNIIINDSTGPNLETDEFGTTIYKRLLLMNNLNIDYTNSSKNILRRREVGAEYVLEIIKESTESTIIVDDKIALFRWGAVNGVSNKKALDVSKYGITAYNNNVLRFQTTEYGTLTEGISYSTGSVTINTTGEEYIIFKKGDDNRYVFGLNSLESGNDIGSNLNLNYFKDDDTEHNILSFTRSSNELKLSSKVSSYGGMKWYYSNSIKMDLRNSGLFMYSDITLLTNKKIQSSWYDGLYNGSGFTVNTDSNNKSFARFNVIEVDSINIYDEEVSSVSGMLDVKFFAESHKVRTVTIL